MRLLLSNRQGLGRRALAGALSVAMALGVNMAGALPAGAAAAPTLGSAVNFSQAVVSAGNKATVSGDATIIMGEAETTPSGVRLENPFAGNTAMTSQSIVDALGGEDATYNCYIWRHGDGSASDNFYIAQYATVEEAMAADAAGKVKIVTQPAAMTPYNGNWEENKGITIMNLAHFLAGGDKAPGEEEPDKTTDPAATESAAPAATESAAPAATESAAPVTTETTPPSGSETTPPSGSETTPPSGSETTPPSGSETTPPSGSETTPPSGSETTPPSGSETTPPSGSETTPPSGSETNPPGGATDKPVLLGDVNLDGEVKLDDANAALLAALGIGDPLTGDALKAADVNGDGEVKLDDANAILLAALGIKELEAASLSAKADLAGGDAEITSSTALDFPLPEWETGATVSMWVKAASDQAAPIFTFVDKGSFNNKAYGQNNKYGGAILYTDGTFVFGSDDANSNGGNGMKRNQYCVKTTSDSVPSKNPGKWTYVTISMQNDGVEVYYNGVKADYAPDANSAWGKNNIQYFNYSYMFKDEQQPAKNRVQELVSNGYYTQRLSDWSVNDALTGKVSDLGEGFNSSIADSADMMEYLTASTTELYLGGDDGLANPYWQTALYGEASVGMGISNMIFEATPADQTKATSLYKAAESSKPADEEIEQPKPVEVSATLSGAAIDVFNWYSEIATGPVKTDINLKRGEEVSGISVMINMTYITDESVTAATTGSKGEDGKTTEYPEYSFEKGYLQFNATVCGSASGTNSGYDALWGSNPVSKSAVKIVPPEDDMLFTIAVKVGNNKTFTVVEDGGKVVYEETNSSGDNAYWLRKLDLEKGKTYYVYMTGSSNIMIGYMGWEKLEPATE